MLGLNWTREPAVVYVPPIGEPSRRTRKLVVAMEAGSIDSEKLITSTLLSDTFDCPLVGLTEMTVGAVVSEFELVVKVQVNGEASAFPSKSVAPVEMVAVYVVEDAKLALGVNVATEFVLATVPTTFVPLAL
jgi:hypothetical protein